MKENNNLKYIILPISAKKKNFIMEWDKQWKLHCNAERFIDNLVWDNQLYIWYCINNQFEGEGYKVCCNLSYTQTWHIFFLVFFFKTSIINISKLTESWNYRPGSDITISLNHLATKYLWKTIMNFSNAAWRKVENWNRLKSTHSGSDYVCGSSILYCVRYL